MAALLRMPEVAAGAESAILAGWSVAEHATFSTGDMIAVVETDKAVVDIEAETDGVLLRTLVPGGTRVAVGDPIALIGSPGESVTDIDAALSELGYAVSPAAVSPASQSSSSASPPSTLPTSAGRGPGAAQEGTGAAEEAHGIPDPQSPPRRLFASPLVRRLAKEAGLDLAGIRGSGPHGRIVKRDLAAARAQAAGAAAAGAAMAPAPVAVPAPVTAGAAVGGTLGRGVGATGATDIPHTRLRRAIAARLTESKQTAPHFYVRGTARVDRLLALRAELNADESTRVSVNDLVIKAVARAHRLVPALNVIWTQDAIRRFDSVDVAVAVATDNGLVTPVLRGVQDSSVGAVSATVRDYAERARAGQLRQAELEGGTITVTNLGMFGTQEFAAIINPPQAAILAVGAARQEPVVQDGAVVVATTMTVTLSVDHRPVDGVDAARWMQVFIELLESPARILL